MQAGQSVSEESGTVPAELSILTFNISIATVRQTRIVLTFVYYFSQERTMEIINNFYS